MFENIVLKALDVGRVCRNEDNVAWKDKTGQHLFSIATRPLCSDVHSLFGRLVRY